MDNVFTKRKALSTIAKLFDPLGFLSPIIIIAKIFIQELWTLKIGWDDPLPSHFEDASQKVVAAILYLRVTDYEGLTTVHFVASKTKVAPLKRLTIPRLELCGAVLLTKLVSHFLTVLELKNLPIILWTDSSITHIWLNNHPSKWKEFVRNSVSLVQETLPQTEWRFVPGYYNPSDIATRGATPSQLLDYSKWWNGPQWLSQERSAWPQKVTPTCLNDNLEEHSSVVHVVTSSKEKEWDLLSRYSSLTKLYRVTVLYQRAVSRFRGIPLTTSSSSLSIIELNNTKLFCIKVIQRLFFLNEITYLSKGLPIPRSSPLIRLTPFLDALGLLRVGGRLQNSLLNEEEKHPWILPRKSTLTSLIIADAHHRALHGGTQVTLSLIRTEYWIIGGRAPVRSWILKCVKCTRFRQQRAQQLMGQLPTKRITPSRPFTHTGIDYAGPFLIKTWRGKNARTYKSYVALFVCFATSAIHLELVTDYSSDAFIAAYKRFISRRGICSTLTSDCGTTLKGADSELQRLFSQAKQEFSKLAVLLANSGTQWEFNPPSAPHFGGKWEAGIKSMKHHLIRVVGNTTFTYEEMSTLLTQIEAVLNSRPLYPLTEDPDDLNVLTPGHFIMSCAPMTVPKPSLELVKTARLSRWQLIRQALDSFWTRWSHECMQQYYATYKWNKVTPSLQDGTIVLVIDERYPPSKWPLGRIIATHPGKDGHTRVVTVKTQTSLLKRPIVKIYPLPVVQ
ncbi:PREDICTED: uncharacterized protein LOC108783389 [Cyphomyrmex costatus]|uniref:uncharacterized protein LOC108783389 n=1 Tax=Cyphomyrmex costatus TaxID=456900 RepID=UPI0008522CC4|nr:PREDICTED: uncharacterized protein LOC108783389 [Cyphomyrmex costatus]